jgi:hypothetical protein
MEEQSKYVPEVKCEKCSDNHPFNSNDLIAEVIKTEVTRQITVFKEQVSDVIGKQFDALKAGEVARAVKNAVAYAMIEAMKAKADIHKAVVSHNVEMAQKVYFKVREEINNLDYPSVAEHLKTLPGEYGAKKEIILSKRIAARNLRQSLADADLAVKEAEANLLADITAETLPNSEKPRFSNDKLRQAELMNRKKIDPDYQAATENYRQIKEQCESLDDEIYALETEIKSIEMQFQGECRIADAITAQISVYAAALGVGEIVSECSAAQNEKVKNNEEGVW